MQCAPPGAPAAAQPALCARQLPPSSRKPRAKAAPVRRPGDRAVGRRGGLNGEARVRRTGSPQGKVDRDRVPTGSPPLSAACWPDGTGDLLVTAHRRFLKDPTRRNRLLACRPEEGELLRGRPRGESGQPALASRGLLRWPAASRVFQSVLSLSSPS